MLSRPLLLALSVLILSAPSLGQTQRPAQDTDDGTPKACVDDVKKLCPHAEGPVARRACMISKRKDWSDACRQALEHKGSVPTGGDPKPGARGRPVAGRSPLRQLLYACVEEIKGFCNDSSGKGGVTRCLGSHSEDLSPGCRAALAAYDSTQVAGGTGKDAPTRKSGGR